MAQPEMPSIKHSIPGAAGSALDVENKIVVDDQRNTRNVDEAIATTRTEMDKPTAATKQREAEVEAAAKMHAKTVDGELGLASEAAKVDIAEIQITFERTKARAKGVLTACVAAVAICLICKTGNAVMLGMENAYQEDTARIEQAKTESESNAQTTEKALSTDNILADAVENGQSVTYEGPDGTRFTIGENSPK